VTHCVPDERVVVNRYRPKRRRSTVVRPRLWREPEAWW
jgi:hypothetical protein